MPAAVGRGAALRPAWPIRRADEDGRNPWNESDRLDVVVDVNLDGDGDGDVLGRSFLEHVTVHVADNDRVAS